MVTVRNMAKTKRVEHCGLLVDLIPATSQQAAQADFWLPSKSMEKSNLHLGHFTIGTQSESELETIARNIAAGLVNALRERRVLGPAIAEPEQERFSGM